jgi:hypothetical protein
MNYITTIHSSIFVTLTSFTKNTANNWSLYGINGTICAEGWDSNDATVVCKQMAYAGGVPFGPRYYSSRTPIWMSNVSCSGTERDIKFCNPQGELDISRSCRSSRHAARVFCYRGDGK